MPENQNFNHQINQETGPNNSKGGMLWIIIVVIIIALVIALVLVLKNKPTEPKVNLGQEAALVEKDDGFPDVFYSYTGTILAIGRDEIVINALADQNYLKEDKQIKALVNNETTFTQITIPQKLENIQPGQTGKLFNRVEIKFSDLKLGDKATLIAFENVKGKTEFVAKKVEVTIN